MWVQVITFLKQLRLQLHSPTIFVNHVSHFFGTVKLFGFALLDLKS